MIKFNITLNDKEIETKMFFGIASKKPEITLTRVNQFGCRVEVGSIQVNDDLELTLKTLRGVQSIVGTSPILDNKDICLIRKNCEILIAANKPKYTPSREEIKEWNDDQHGHLILSK